MMHWKPIYGTMGKCLFLLVTTALPMLTISIWRMLSGELPPPAPDATPTPVTEKEIRDATERAIPLIQQSDAIFRERRSCFSCHHQTIGLVGLAEAKKRGFSVNEADFANQVKHIWWDLNDNLDLYSRGEGQPGGVDRAGYALWGLALGNAKPDATITAVVEYLIRQDVHLDHWERKSQRPPSQYSTIGKTVINLKMVDNFATPEQQQQFAERRKAIHKWLVTSQPRETEDKVFRIFGLIHLGEDATRAAAALIREQREDGGWAQKPGMKSDAYATATVLVALHEAGIRPGESAYQRGLRYLIDTQQKDGSWHVTSRTEEIIQRHFDSGFPHGEDQFISIAASAWAVKALSLAVEPRMK